MPGNGKTVNSSQFCDAVLRSCCWFQLNLDSYERIHCLRRCGAQVLWRRDFYLSPITIIPLLLLLLLIFSIFVGFALRLRWEIETIEMCWKQRERERGKTWKNASESNAAGFFCSFPCRICIAHTAQCTPAYAIVQQCLCLCNLPLRLFAAQRRNYINPNENNSNMGAIRLAPRARVRCHRSSRCKCTDVSAGAQRCWLQMCAVHKVYLFWWLFEISVCLDSDYARGIIKACEWASERRQQCVPMFVHFTDDDDGNC